MMGVTVGCSVIILRKYRGVCNWRTPFQSRFQALKPSFIEFLELSLVHVYSVESNSAISWAAACQGLPMEFSRQEYWTGLPFPPPEDLPDPRTEPTSPALAGGFFTTELPGKPALALRELSKQS